MGCPRSGGPGLLAFAPAARFGRRRRLLGLEPGRDRLGLGPPLAAGRLLLLFSLHLRPPAGLRGGRHPPAPFRRLAQGRLPARPPPQGPERRRAWRNRLDPAGAGAPSVLSRPAIASGLGRRLRRAGFFFLSPSASASTPVSVEYVTPSPSSAGSRRGDCRRASPIRSEIAAVMSETARIASSFPGIGTLIKYRSAFVSTIATTGIPSLFASATAIRSFFESATNNAPGSRPMFLMPERYFSSFKRSRLNSSCSFLVWCSNSPSLIPCSRSFSRLICFLIVWKFVSVPPSQRSVT